MIKGGALFKRNHEGIYFKCLNRIEANEMLQELHDMFGTTHGAPLAITHLILRAGYY